MRFHGLERPCAPQKHIEEEEEAKGGKGGERGAQLAVMRRGSVERILYRNHSVGRYGTAGAQLLTEGGGLLFNAVL